MQHAGSDFAVGQGLNPQIFLQPHQSLVQATPRASDWMILNIKWQWLFLPYIARGPDVSVICLMLLIDHHLEVEKFRTEYNQCFQNKPTCITCSKRFLWTFVNRYSGCLVNPLLSRCKQLGLWSTNCSGKHNRSWWCHPGASCDMPADQHKQHVLLTVSQSNPQQLG